MIVVFVLGLPEDHYVRVPVRSHVNHENGAVTTTFSPRYVLVSRAQKSYLVWAGIKSGSA